MDYHQVAEFLQAKREGNDYRADCEVCGAGNMIISAGDKQPVLFDGKSCNCNMHEWCKVNVPGYWEPQKERAGRLNPAQQNASRVDVSTAVPAAGVNDNRTATTKEELAAGYGLAWEDYSRHGCKVVVDWFFRPLEKKVPAVGYPVLLHDGKTTRWKYKSFERFDKKGDGKTKREQGYDKLRTENWCGPKTGLFPAAPPDGKQTIYICGGEEKALLLRRLGFCAYVFGNDISSLPSEICRLLLSWASDFVICLDQGEGSLEGVAKSLLAEAFTIKAKVAVALIRWPVDRPKGHDVNDELLLHGEKSLRDIIAAADPYTPERQTVIESTNREKNVLNAITCLGQDESIFTRCEILVKVLDGAISTLAKSCIGERISANADWMRQDKQGNLHETTPDSNLCQNIYDRGDFPGIEKIRGVVNYPLLRENGTVHQRHGYDPQTGYWLETGENWNVPEKPNLEILLAPLAEFPFVDPHHKAAFVAAMLTIVVQHLVPGNLPAFAIDASSKRTGKGLLGKVASIITTGKPGFSTTALKFSEDEMLKTLFAAAVQGVGILYFDNISRSIESDVLCSLITEPRLSDRVLGHTKIVEVEYRPFIVFNGNNLNFRQDIIPRILICRMEYDGADTHLRKFKIPDLVAHVTKNRKALLENLLAVARYYILAGRPLHIYETWGGFEGWLNFVGNAIVHAGLPNPNTNNFVHLNSHDPKQDGIQALLPWLHNTGRKWAVKELLTQAGNDPEPLHEILVNIANLREAGLPTSKLLGDRLRENNGAVYEGLKLRWETDKNRVKYWFAEKLQTQSAERGGDVLSAYRGKDYITSYKDTYSNTYSDMPLEGPESFRAFPPESAESGNLPSCAYCKKPLHGKGTNTPNGTGCSQACATALAQISAVQS
jgi:hypothetical protein